MTCGGAARAVPQRRSPASVATLRAMSPAPPSPVSPDPVTRFVTAVRAGYDRNSARVLVLLAVSYVAVAVIWNRLIDLSRGMDWLLAGIWAFMTAVLCWRIDPRRDAVRALVGFLGGLLIEAWGTQTDLWSYYTAERPPPWIIPAWPVAALTIDRLAFLLDPLLPPGRLDAAWRVLLPAFVAYMTWFVWPSVHLWGTWLAIVGMLLVLGIPGSRREDVCLFVGGSLLGIFLEYWGTSRWCWRYYTHEVPPLPAVLAHGFASVAFARGAGLLDALTGWRRSLLRGGAGHRLPRS